MRGFVFDLDNTLFDRYATLEKILAENFDFVKPYLNVSYDLERAAEHLIHTESMYIIDDWHSVYDRLLPEHFFRAGNTPDFGSFWRFIRGNFMKTAVEFPFTKPLLKLLRDKGYKLGVITNGGADIQRGKLKLLGLDGFFDEIVISGELAYSRCGDEKCREFWKPGSIIFEETARRLACQPCELYYVGDNPKNDVIASKNAGYEPVWIMSKSPWPYEDEKLPRYCFNDISGLESLI